MTSTSMEVWTDQKTRYIVSEDAGLPLVEARPGCSWLPFKGTLPSPWLLQVQTDLFLMAEGEEAPLQPSMHNFRLDALADARDRKSVV